MSVVRVWPTYAGQESEENARGQFPTLRLLVQTDRATDSSLVVLDHPAIPRLGDPWPLAPQRPLRVARRRANQLSDCLWEVAIGYEPAPGAALPAPEAGQESVELPSWSYGSRPVEFYEHFDADGKPILNSAGQRFANPPKQYKYLRTVTISRKQRTYHDGLYWELIGKVNSHPFLGYPVDSVLCEGIDATGPVNWQDTPVWQVTFRFIVNPDLWRPTLVADEGYAHVRVDENNQPIYVSPGESAAPPRPVVVAAEDIEGAKTGRPVLLDGTGRPLPPGEEPHMLHFNLYKQADFSWLGLPAGWHDPAWRGRPTPGRGPGKFFGT